MTSETFTGAACCCCSCCCHDLSWGSVTSWRFFFAWLQSVRKSKRSLRAGTCGAVQRPKRVFFLLHCKMRFSCEVCFAIVFLGFRRVAIARVFDTRQGIVRTRTPLFLLSFFFVLRFSFVSFFSPKFVLLPQCIECTVSEGHALFKEPLRALSCACQPARPSSSSAHSHWRLRWLRRNGVWPYRAAPELQRATIKATPAGRVQLWAACALALRGSAA